MKRPSDTNDTNDELLDRIATQLRNQSVPAMPSECKDFDPVAGAVRTATDGVDAVGRSRWSKQVWVWATVAAVCLAIASALFIASDGNKVEAPIAAQSNEPQRDAISDDQDDIVAFPIAVDDDLKAMHVGLDAIEGEVARLRQKAALLDARRRASELIGAMAMAE